MLLSPILVWPRKAMAPKAMKTMKAEEAAWVRRVDRARAEAKARAKAKAAPKAKAKAKAEPAFHVWMKNENEDSIKVSVHNNPTVEQFMIEAILASTEGLTENEIADDMLAGNLYMATLGGRILNKRSRLMNIIDSGTHVEVHRRGRGGMQD